MVLAALEQRNKERILAGLPTYPSIEGMVESYMEFEGAEKGMSLLEAEDEVVRYLQRKAARRVDLGPPSGHQAGSAGRGRGTTGLQPAGCAALSRGAAQRLSAHRGGCGAAASPLRRLWSPPVAEPLASLWGIRPRSALLLALPQPCPCPYPCLLPRQALLDEVP